jgi:hypothetical protein
MITRPESPVYLRAIDEVDLEPGGPFEHPAYLQASAAHEGTEPSSLRRTTAAWHSSQAWARARTSTPDVHPQPSRPPRR